VKRFSLKSMDSDHARYAVTRIRRSGKAVMASCAALLIAAGSLAVGGCSKSKNNPPSTLGSQSQSAPVQSAGPALSASQAPVGLSQSEVAKKNSIKGPVKRLTVRTYKDADSGVSFAYPRKATLELRDKAQQDSVSQDRLPMSYVAPGGKTLAVVQLPASKGELSGALLLVNVNKELTAEECSQFPAEAQVEGELSSSQAPADHRTSFVQGSKILVSGTDYFMLEKQPDHAFVRYYHRFAPAPVGDKGVCYEFGMFVNSASEQDLKSATTADRQHAFTKLEKILASVKTSQRENAPVIEAANPDSDTKSTVSELPMEAAKAVAKQENPR